MYRPGRQRDGVPDLNARVSGISEEMTAYSLNIVNTFWRCV